MLLSNHIIVQLRLDSVRSRNRTDVKCFFRLALFMLFLLDLLLGRHHAAKQIAQIDHTDIRDTSTGFFRLLLFCLF